MHRMNLMQWNHIVLYRIYKKESNEIISSMFLKQEGGSFHFISDRATA